MTTPEAQPLRRGQPGARWTACTIALVCVLLPDRADAYLDAGTGSMVLQVIIAGVTGALITLKLYWARIKARFGGQPIEVAKRASDAPENEPR